MPPATASMIVESGCGWERGAGLVRRPRDQRPDAALPVSIYKAAVGLLAPDTGHGSPMVRQLTYREMADVLPASYGISASPTWNC